jgi:Iron/manganese superoxide dismutases, alpha-hairpin domain
MSSVGFNATDLLPVSALCHGVTAKLENFSRPTSVSIVTFMSCGHVAHCEAVPSDGSFTACVTSRWIVVEWTADAICPTRAMARCDLPYMYNAFDPYIDETTMRVRHDKQHGTTQ